MVAPSMTALAPIDIGLCGFRNAPIILGPITLSTETDHDLVADQNLRVVLAMAGAGHDRRVVEHARRVADLDRASAPFKLA